MLESLAAASALLAALAASAPDSQLGAWHVGLTTDRKGAYAATLNDSGGILGQYCYPDSDRCVWLLVNDTECKPGGEYPILVNADTGAASTHVVCVEVDGKARYAFGDFDLVDGVVRRADWVGFAFPMKNGRFQVSRFRLEGAAKAVELLRSVVERYVGRPKAGAGTGGTADESL